MEGNIYFGKEVYVQNCHINKIKLFVAIYLKQIKRLKKMFNIPNYFSV